MEWYHVCWPRLTAKRVEPVVSISWASFYFSLGNLTTLTLSIIISVQNSANTVSLNTFFSYSKCSKCHQPAFTYSLNLFLKLKTALFTGSAENCPIFSPCATFSSKTVVVFGRSFQKASRVVPPQTWYLYYGIQISRELDDHCYFSVICIITLCVPDCWATHAMCAEPNAYLPLHLTPVGCSLQ